MDLIARWAAERGDAPAVIEGARRLAWGEYFTARNRLADSLARLGLRPAERVVIYAQNSLENLLVSAAVRALGAIALPMNHRLLPDEVVYILNDSAAAFVVLSDAFLPAAEKVRHTAPAVRQWIIVGDERRPWAAQLADLLPSGRPEPPPATGAGGSMIYTAGTTGRPKGALRRVLEPGSVLPRLAALDLLDPGHVHLVAGPLYHSAPGGFAFYAHMVGSTVVVMRKFDAEDALREIERHRCTSTFMAPTLLKRIVDLPPAARARYDVSSMRVIVVAAAPCPMRVKEEIIQLFGPVLYEFYGSTELGINTVLRPEDVLRKPGSCGRAAPGVELMVLDDDGRPVPAGTPGELFVRRYPGVFDGYHNRPEATAETVRGDWLTVGDVAWIDDEGFVHICDRKRDMIISGGVNIYPAEIEDVLHRHPAVLDAAVFGVPDAEWGERVHAAVQLQPGSSASAEELVDFCRARLAAFKIPRDVSFHADFPRDAAGKLLKRQLREPHWAGHARRV